VVILPRTRYLYSKINLQSTIFQTDPWNLKMISKFALDTFQNYNLVPETSNSHIFSTVNPISVILAPKFSEPHPLSFHAFIIHVFFHFDCLCAPRLGDLASEQQLSVGFQDQVYEDFQGQVFGDSQLFFPEQQGKCP
jgi:hypothetical protein